MIIRNKFNGFAYDGSRRCYDPATIAAGLATAGEAVVAPAVASTVGGLGATAGTIGALESGMMLGSGLMALPAGVSAATNLLGAAAPALETATPAIVSALETAPAVVSPLASLTPNGLGSLAQTIGYTAPQVASIPQIAPQVADMITPMADVPTSLAEIPTGGAAAQYVQNAPAYPPEGVTGNTAQYAQDPNAPQGGWWEDTKGLLTNNSWDNLKDYAKKYPLQTASAVMGLSKLLNQQPTVQKQPSYLRPYQSTRQVNPAASPMGSTSERQWFTGGLQALPIQQLAVGGPVETMSAMNAVGDNQMYPQSQLQTSDYSNPMVQRPFANNVIKSGVDVNVDPYTGEQKMAHGGIAALGGYSDGGRLLKGPGDGVSDSIPAVIGNKQPARLADGEFVVPARIVSELGNGSTEAGARKLYAMMDRVQKARGKTTGKNRVATDTNADKYLPA